MKKLALLSIAFVVLGLAANPAYYPMTTLAENCLVYNNAACDYNNISLSNVLDETNRSEFLTARLYHNSPDLTNPSADQRFLDYGVTTVPTVVINGAMNLVGGATAATYLSILDNYKFTASPLKMQITNFNPSTGAVSVGVTLLDSNVPIVDQDLVYFLVEDNVDSATNVTRQVMYQSISLPTAGNEVTFNNTFTIQAGWNVNNLWAMAFVQLDDHQILQAASTLPFPTYNVRCAFDWDPHNLVGDPSSSLTSPPLWLFNTGSADNFTIQVVVDNAPADWSFNFCDEVGNCYPGNMPLAFNMAAGAMQAYHLNLWIGSTGVAQFHFLVNSANSGAFVIPFTCRSSDSANEDLVLQPSMSLGANHPNPFRATTAFSVNSDKTSVPACIEIFNLKGQLVGQTAPLTLHQGENSIAWQAPENLPAGVYFYRLKGESATLRRMLLVK